MSLPIEILMEIYHHTDAKYNLGVVFPVLKQAIPGCYWCNKVSTFVMTFTGNSTCMLCPKKVVVSRATYLCKPRCKKFRYYFDFSIIKAKPNNGYSFLGNFISNWEKCVVCCETYNNCVLGSGFKLQKVNKNQQVYPEKDDVDLVKMCKIIKNRRDLKHTFIDASDSLLLLENDVADTDPDSDCF